MFAVIYRGYVYPDREAEYKRLWRQVATYFIEHRGALGSCLHKTEQGEWIAYSRWPSRELRDASWGENDVINSHKQEIKALILNLKACLDTSKPQDEICLEVEDDLLLGLK